MNEVRSTPYHDGEIEVQRRAGVAEMAARIGRSIHDRLPAAAVAFLSQQPFVVIGGTDDDGRVWASLLEGEPGFVKIPDDRTLEIEALPSEQDPLRAAFLAPAPLGLLAIEFATRRRMRVNGTGHQLGDRLVVRADQVYSNCPKYIERRVLTPSEQTRPPATVVRRETLSAAQRRQIEQTDTFFIASAAAGGADASHRGGAPGFVRVASERRLVWPDYSGNAMFQTLGNVAANPSAGLLFVDFATGSSLQVTGRARIVWSAGEVAQVAGAERLVELEIDGVVETASATGLRAREGTPGGEVGKRGEV